MLVPAVAPSPASEKPPVKFPRRKSLSDGTGPQPQFNIRDVGGIVPALEILNDTLTGVDDPGTYLNSTRCLAGYVSSRREEGERIPAMPESNKRLPQTMLVAGGFLEDEDAGPSEGPAAKRANVAKRLAAETACQKATAAGWIQQMVYTLSQGDVLGEIALLNPRGLALETLRAASPCTVYCLDKEACSSLFTAKEAKVLTQLLEASVYESSYSLRRFLITQSKLFLNATPALVGDAVDHLEPMNCRPGRVLIRQGETAQGLFIVRSGVANCYIDDEESPDGLKLVKVVKPGEHFGELSLLEGEGAITKAHVHAGDSDCRVLLLEPDSFDTLCDLHQEVRGRLLRTAPKYTLITFFVEFPLLKDSPVELAEQLAGAATPGTPVDGVMVQQAGEVPEAFFLLKDGRVRMGENLYSPEDGFYCGGTCVNEEPATEDVVCEGNCTFLKVSKKQMEKVGAKHPEFLELVQTFTPAVREESQTDSIEPMQREQEMEPSLEVTSDAKPDNTPGNKREDTDLAVLNAIKSLAADVRQMSSRLDRVESSSSTTATGR